MHICSILILSASTSSSRFALPFHDPVIVFGITLLVILVVPFVFTRLKLPGIIGLILSGMLLGQYGFNVLESNGSIELLGNVGIMYLMFLTGFELDLKSFIENRNKNIVFGLLTFAVPFIVGMLLCHYLFGFGLLKSLLIASMFSTQTLIAYPIVSRRRLTKSVPVGISVGGTIITDTLVLVLLILIIGLHNGESSFGYWATMVVSVLAYIFFVTWVMPRFVRWFFGNVNTDIMSQFVFVLTMVFIAGILAELIQLEPIIGAFLAGIVLNKQIPSSSKLADRIEFVGNAIFIPFFMLYVGMLIDLKAFVSGWETIRLSLILFVMATASKWLAAFISQKLFGYSRTDRNLIFGLSTAHAAATIAIILIGFKIGVVGADILNAAVVIIFLSCIVSALVTERVTKKIVKESQTTQNIECADERLLVTVANPTSINNLVNLSTQIQKGSSSNNQMVLLNVVKDEAEIKRNAPLQEIIDQIAETTGTNLQYAVRMDINTSSGIIRASKELQSTSIIMGWNGRYSAKHWIFGSILDGVLKGTSQQVVVANTSFNPNKVDSILVIAPPLAEIEHTFSQWLTTIINLANNIRAKIIFMVESSSRASFEASIAPYLTAKQYSIQTVESWIDGFDLLCHQNTKCLPVIISARIGSISHNPRINSLPKIISKQLHNHNFILIYPAHSQDLQSDTRSLLAGTGQMYVEE